MPEEFDCPDCGRHIVRWGGGYRLCAECIFMPGWFMDPALRRTLDPDLAPPNGEGKP